MNKEVQNYYSNTADNSRAQLESLRKIIADLLPSSSEVIHYGIPTFVMDSKNIVGIGGWNDFVSLYPYGSSQITKFANELKVFKTTKGAIQFKLDAPLPKDLIKKIVKDRLKDLDIE